MALPLNLFLISEINAQYNENLIKAAYIERITRFVDWPAKAVTAADESFVIGVYGENGFYNTLTDVFKIKPIKNQKVKVITIKSIEELASCKLCYISDKAGPTLNKFVEAANSVGVLLISESTDFCKEGVHINFYVEDEKLKFEINQTSIDYAGFKVSYLLMQNTRIIK